MGWETDQPPIAYLERRIKYYKKMRGRYKNMHENENIVQACGGMKKFKKLLVTRTQEVNDRIAEFEKAVEILKRNGD